MKPLWRFAVLACAPIWAQTSPTINELPSREFGHAKLLNPPTSGAPNLLEGRELSTPLGVAVGPSGGPLYVADTTNHRVLAWRNPASLTKGDPADKVIGQRDFFSNITQGPGRDLTSGLTLPSGVAVDIAGNLYVLDTGNNRIVRYPSPFDQTNDPLQIDLVIGQKTQSSGNIANENQPKPSNKTLSLSPGGTFLRSGMTFDSQGNLWVADPGNHRVLRFPADPSTKILPVAVEPPADRVYGQVDFTSNTAPSCSGNACQTNLSVLLQPQSVAVDSNGALYVADGFARVVYFPTPNSGAAATQVLGVIPTPAAGQVVTFPTDYSLGNSSPNAPLTVFANGTAIFVADTVANRVVRYTAPAQFISSPTAPSPKIEAVFGQADLFGGKVNRGQIEPGANTLSSPFGGTFDSSGRLWLADTNNNRVLSYPASASFNYDAANVVVGQTDFPFNTPNLIEGKEVWFVNGGSPGGGIAVDRNSNPPHLYIADTYNNRILGFRDARAVGADVRTLLTQKADLVIGQPAGDFFRSIVNSPGGEVDHPTQTGLFHPVGLAVDDSGRLWVADSGNGRALRFPAPFNVPAGTDQKAELVLGQSDFVHNDLRSATDHTMSTPYGLALYPGGHLAVSDPALNRVLVFQSPFSNGQSAVTVVGQQNFSSSGSSGSLTGINSPRHLATDSGGRLYVADSGNNRVAVFRDTSNIPQTGPSAPFTFSFSQPQGIAVSPFSGEMWVASGNSIFHLPEVTTYQNTGTIFQQFGSNAPLAIALDSFENPIVAEALNRVTFYFAKLMVRNAFTFTSTRPLTPGMWAQAAPIGKTFPAVDEAHDIPPYPTTVAGLQMLVNGAPSGIYSVVQNAYTNFVIPWSAPTSGNAEFLLFNPTTKEIVAAGTVAMTVADPAIRTTNFLGTGQILAINLKDNTLNGPQNQVARGDMLQLALTGQGLVNNPPADGFPPGAGTQIQTNPLDLHVLVNGKDIGASNVLFSGLDPTYPGSWTVNIRIPTIAENGPPPGNSVSIIVLMRDVPSNWGYDPNNGLADIPLQVTNGRITTIAVK